ncbi:MAG: hypothetical protein J2P33_17150 [Actinobacteria bacterium]|nr:hypothetical protein [Actinomycetota bacterium]
MKASPEAQRRLLELAEADAELSRLEHRQRTLPETQERERLQARDSELRDEIAGLEAEESDLGREQSKAEADVEQVRTRIGRDQQKLDAGQVSSPRELENLQSEITSLLRRQSDLEEVVLDVMERLEGVQQRRAARATERAALTDELADVTTRRDAALADIAEQAGKAGDQRSRVASEVPADLLALYDRLREQHGGVGAAALRRGQCQGCHLSLNTVEMNRIRAAPPDEVLRCDECRRILVRTDESGL